MANIYKSVWVKQTPNGEFYLLEVGSEMYGKVTAGIWIHPRLVEDREGGKVVGFPARAKLEKTPKGNWVLRPSPDHITYYLFVRCGYKGFSTIEVLKPAPVEVLPFRIFDSPLGRSGVSKGMLVTVPVGEIIYRWSRTGRTYGKATEGITVVSPDGSERVFEGIEDLEELSEIQSYLEEEVDDGEDS